MRSAWFFLGIAIAIVAAVAMLLRRGNLREKYAALWVVVGLAVIVLALFPGLLQWIARLVGVEVPSNLLFAIALLFLLAVALHLSLEVSRTEEQIRTLAEHVAMLNRALDQDGRLGPPDGSPRGSDPSVDNSRSGHDDQPPSSQQRGNLGDPS